MKLNAPSFGIWLISVIIVAVVVLSVYLRIQIPVLSPLFADGNKQFYAVLLAWILLFLGTTFNL
jgi:hypothetical protein